jgi:hypothetical protein
MCLMAKVPGILGNLVAQGPNNNLKTYVPKDQSDW